MKIKLPKIWLDKLEVLDIAFQPILNIHTGETYAVEALLRNYQEVGFKSISSLFDEVFKDNILYTFDIALRKKTLQKFIKIKNFENLKLFYNLDNRLLSMPDFSDGNTDNLLKECPVKKENICFEISERHEISTDSNLEKILKHYRNEDFTIAIDDFGVGYSGYKLLYDSTPDFIKIDRFFLTHIECDLKKKLMVRNITHLAIQLGIKVVAEGVETKEEFFICKELGCHFVQGYLIQKPTRNTDEILQKYDNIITLNENDRRVNIGSNNIENYIDKIQAFNSETNMIQVLEYFKTNKTIPIAPMVNINSEPIGVICESQIKDLLYSPYGISLMLNKKLNLKNMVNFCGNADINSSIATIVELFSNNPDSIGIIITKSSKYYGFLSARSIISIMNEENLLFARDQNPLTKLPGNIVIEKYIANVAQNSNPYLLCYFDLDNFKVFNDVYGFRNGDRVIQLFADLLKKDLPQYVFKAHIGGDDFFVGFNYEEDIKYGTDLEKIKNLIGEFSNRAKKLYSKKDRNRGFTISEDRESNIKQFPLLTVSASVLVIKKNTTKRSSDSINNILATQKKVAKKHINHIAISHLI